MNDLWKRHGTTLVVWAALLAMPWWMPLVGGYTALGTRVLVMGLAAMALNFLLGFTGVLSFGHAAYFGLAAYGTGLTLRYLSHSTPLAVLVGVATGAAAAAVVGALISRLRGVYYAMVTIAIGQVFYFIAYRWNSVTGGDDGLSGWQRQPVDLGPLHLDILHDDKVFYFVVLAAFAVGVGVMGGLLRSPFGRSLVAIRENERRARFLGVPVEIHVWWSWLVSCTVVSFAGCFYALLNNFADPHQLRWDQSGDFVIMAVLGGMRSFWGPLVGAAIFVVLEDFVSSRTQNWMSVVGLVFMLVVLFFPRGVMGLVKREGQRA